MSLSPAVKVARDRLEELIRRGRSLVERGRRNRDSSLPDALRSEWATWRANAEQALRRLLPSESHYQRDFDARIHPLVHHVDETCGVLEALLEDVDRGYLDNMPMIVRAEVAGDFLDQAQHLLDHAFHVPAAQLAGAVLEDALRKLCDRRSVTMPSRPTIEPLNVALTRAGVYDVGTQKMVTAWADVRNKADHGHFDKFSAQEVKIMLLGVRTFVGQHIK